MEKDTILILQNEKFKIESQIKQLREILANLDQQLYAINIVLSRNNENINTINIPAATTTTTTEMPKMSFGGDIDKKYTKKEGRIIKALYSLGGKGTTQGIYNHLKTIYPDEDQDKLLTSVQQFVSKLSRSGEIGVEKGSGKRGGIYYIKEKESEM